MLRIPPPECCIEARQRVRQSPGVLPGLFYFVAFNFAAWDHGEMKSLLSWLQSDSFPIFVGSSVLLAILIFVGVFVDVPSAFDNYVVTLAAVVAIVVAYLSQRWQR